MGTAIKLAQLQQESDTWKRLLGFMMEENIILKKRLTEILSTKFNHNLLEDVEKFHAQFLRTDEHISLLRNELAELDKLLVREIFEDGLIIDQVNLKLKHIRGHALVAENHFGKLKASFNSYLSEKYNG